MCLALAESERYLPGLIDELDQIIEELGLRTGDSDPLHWMPEWLRATLFGGKSAL